MAIKGSFNNWHELALTQQSESEFHITLLLPPGSHRLWFLYDNKLHTSRQLSTVKWDSVPINEVHVSLRVTEINLASPDLSPGPRRFMRAKSVFAEFREDDEELRDKMYASDAQHYKLPKIVRNQEQLMLVR